MDGNVRRNGPKFSSGGPINASSCHAECLPTLSEIDSMWQNGEIDTEEAKRMALLNCDGNILVIQAMFAK